jgi:hypothetical protein
MSKKKRKKKRLESTTVLEIVDRTYSKYSGKWVPSAEPMVETDGSKDEIKTFGSLTELFNFMDNK